MSKCPLCGIRVSYQHNLKAHLAGREPKGHGKTEADADDISRTVFDGTFRPVVKPISVSPIPPHDPALLADPYANFLIRLFETMVENKRLPKYQFERRVDAMITLFLPGILKQVYGWTVELVAPEFPLRKGTKKRSTNVDHLLFRHADGAGNQAAWIFFELKTDSASCNDPQLEIYRSAMAKGMPQLLADLKSIAAVSEARAKYALLIERIVRLPENAPIELVYLAPCRIDTSIQKAHALTFADLQNVTLPESSETWDLLRKLIVPALLK